MERVRKMTGKHIKYKILMTLLICLVLTLSTVALAAGQEVSLELTGTDLTIGNSVSMTITVDGSVKVDNVSVQHLDKFEVLSTSQSSSTNIVNGSRTDMVQIHLDLMPKTRGDYPLVAIIESGKDTFESNAITVHIGEKKATPEGETEDIFIKTNISDESSYFGEKLVLTYELYTNKNIAGYDFTEPLELDGFITEEFSRDKLNQNYVDINGVQYIKIEAKKMMLNPTTTGEFVIPSRRFQVNVGSGGFYETSQPVYFETDEVTIKVAPVPSENKPADFSGLVGQVSVQGGYDKSEVAYGDPVTLNIKLSGSGNLEIIEKLIKENSIKGFTVYETSGNMRESIVDGKYATEKAYEIIMVPQDVGSLTVEPIKISYFDTETAQYQHLELPGATIHVTGEKTVENSVSGDPVAEPVLVSQITQTEVDEDVLVIKLSKRVVKVTATIIGVILLLTFSLLILIKQKRLHKTMDLKTLKSRIRTESDANALYAIYNTYFKSEMGFSLKSSTKDQLKIRITETEISDQLIRVIDYLEHGKYGQDDNINQMKEKMIWVVEKLDGKDE